MIYHKEKFTNMYVHVYKLQNRCTNEFTTMYIILYIHMYHIEFIYIYIYMVNILSAIIPCLSKLWISSLLFVCLLVSVLACFVCARRRVLVCLGSCEPLNKQYFYHKGTVHVFSSDRLLKKVFSTIYNSVSFKPLSE